MYKLLQRLFTKNLTEIPLFFVNFNYKHYKEKGQIDSCMSHIHPLLKDNEIIKETLNKLINYVRDNYDMKEI